MTVLIEDTRQQKGKHNLKHQHFKSNQVELIRCKLPFGDYAPPPPVAIDTKANILELAQNLTNDHIRFREECKLATRCNSQLIILIENEDNIKTSEDLKSWKNPRRFESAKAPKGTTLYKTIITMSKRYNVDFKFCKPCESAEIIERILINGNTRE